MRKDYKSVTDLNLGMKKRYLLKICHDKKAMEELYSCMSVKELDSMLENYKQMFYNQALKALYSSSNYDDLEYHLIMMNVLFNQSSFIDIKKQLFLKLCKKAITINEYCVMRQLIDFKQTSFASFVEILHDQYEVDNEECARICLLEDQYHLASIYLKRLDDCKDEYLLDLLSSFSLYEYVSLMKHYAKKKNRYLLVVSH